ncbi:MerR family transcriptional regulator [Pseudomonas sp. sp1636]|uniref:MerR family transcriptional regulator n=1 Tax=Pseudomonas sp. sp1636 TaxID=3036707 RepID=UPI0025A5EB10|nr:MerR family transcriptional regulator [Pseudomonas sp. sp1636]MDM8349680.1 MerR family transcriptional regulator [Pseudomonas sp. sp1636]
MSAELVLGLTRQIDLHQMQSVEMANSYSIAIFSGEMTMRVNELAKKLGVSADTIRYYTRAGFVTPSKDQSNGYKSYREHDEQRLRFILSARQLGFSVADIGQILIEADGGKSACPTVRHLIALRLQETTQRFDDMQKLRKRMFAALDEWGSKPDRLPSGNSICHLIEDFTL